MKSHWLSLALVLVSAASSTAAQGAVEAVDFTSRVVYRASRPPHYAAWASFFPGSDGRWYIGCEEVTRPVKPLPQASPEHWFGMGLPAGYDKSQYQMEAVLLESTDHMRSWQVISREPYRRQHSVHQFASARTADGRFLRFNWACYALEGNTKTNDILRFSDDNGTTWHRSPPFLPERFAYYPHRLRTLRDGTLVVCLPIAPRWGPNADRPLRTGMQLNTNNEMRMSLCFSFDAGRTWQGPLPILDGQNVSETDFVELADGNLLVINNSIFARPGRQFVYRDGQRFVPGPLEFARGGTVPETVALVKDELLVGCMRAGSYHWSDDLGETWSPLPGCPASEEVYQPWMHALADGRIVCAGHFGADDPISTGRTHDNYINLHTFRVKTNRPTQRTQLKVARDFDAVRGRWLNRFTFTLTAGGRPLAGKPLAVWYVERYQSGYDSSNATPLDKRMQAGGTLARPTTDAAGVARVKLPEKFDAATDPHFSYQLVARFNIDRADADYKPCQTPQLEFYAFAPMPEKLEPLPTNE
jgi:hypothetical protein